MAETPVQASSAPAPLDFFEGMAWAVPTAFAGALASFRFEQGDVLYRDAEAYSALEGAISAESIALQILHPPRSARTTPAEFDGDRRRTSWESEVRLERIQLATGKSAPLVVSQGKLLMTLWSGDEEWLDAEREEPPLPGAARELAARLEQAKSGFGRSLALQNASKGVACRFFFVVDLASDASRVKAQAIADALAPCGRIKSVDLAPIAAGLDEAEHFHPALVVRGIRINGASEGQVEEALRAALYGGGKRDNDLKDGEAETTRRFSVARHGLLESNAATPPDPA